VESFVKNDDCAICDASVEIDDKGIECEICKQWFHTDCVDTEHNEHEVLTNHNNISAVAEMGDRGHNRHRPKRGEAAVPVSQRAGTPPNTMAWGEVYFRTKCRLHPSSRLSTKDESRIGCDLFWG